jgi:hypothetical protein
MAKVNGIKTPLLHTGLYTRLNAKNSNIVLRIVCNSSCVLIEPTKKGEQ